MATCQKETGEKSYWINAHVTNNKRQCILGMEAIINAIKRGNFHEAELQRVRDELEKLKHTKAYEDYGVPYALNIWEKFDNL